MVVPNRPSSCTVPVTPAMLTKSPTLNGRSTSMNAPAAKLPSMPLQAAPIATPAPASIAAMEVVWMPKYPRMPRTRAMFSATLMIEPR